VAQRYATTTQRSSTRYVAIATSVFRTNNPRRRFRQPTAHCNRSTQSEMFLECRLIAVGERSQLQSGPYVDIVSDTTPRAYASIHSEGRAAAARSKMMPRTVNAVRATSASQRRTKRLVYYSFKRHGWLGRRAVSVLDSGAEGPGFKSQPRR